MKHLRAAAPPLIEHHEPVRFATSPVRRKVKSAGGADRSRKAGEKCARFGRFNRRRTMKRRSFNKILAAAGVTASLRNGWSHTMRRNAAGQSLPDIVRNDRSVEICLNSRYSVHSFSNPSLDRQVAANALWAAASAPLLADERIILVAMPDNLYRYRYENGQHTLERHAEGDKRTTNGTSFEIGVATDPAEAIEDAGAALHWAQVASVAFWKTKQGQPVSCPMDSATNSAKNSWNPPSNIHLVNCYGTASVTGITAELAAVSSDKSLPDPVTDGTVFLEDAIKKPLFGNDFLEDDLSGEQISRILWSSYGCTPHNPPGAAGITLASWMMEYFMTGKIYLLSSEGVKRYHMRNAQGAKNSRDHRLETISSTDARSELRSALPRLPQTAPVYFIFCGSKVERPQLLEAGYCGSSALLQATALGIQGHYCARFSEAERTAIQTACGIDVKNIPMLVFSAGKAAGTSIPGRSGAGTHKKTHFRADPNPFRTVTTISFSETGPSSRKMSIFTASGELVRRWEFNGKIPETLVWDGRNDRGATLPAGLYLCRIEAPGTENTLRIQKI